MHYGADQRAHEQNAKTAGEHAGVAQTQLQ
jgi:hypothetical protein